MELVGDPLEEREREVRFADSAGAGEREQLYVGAQNSPLEYSTAMAAISIESFSSNSWLAKKKLTELYPQSLTITPQLLGNNASLISYRATTPIFAIVAPFVIDGTAQRYNTIPATGARASKIVLPT